MMPKRKSESEDSVPRYLLQMSDCDELLPRTPGRGKRMRRSVGDVIDSMGESPVSSSCTASSSSTPSAGFVTPQRTRAYWNLATTPDGYSTPERIRSSELDWLYQPDNAIGSTSQPDALPHIHPSFSRVEPSGIMPVHKDADRYNMEHRNRGKCIIFNHENFDTGFDSRKGSRADAERLEQTFQRLGFQVEICEDYDHKGVLNKINELIEEDHTDNDCLCVFVLTHGLKDDFISAKDSLYKIDLLWKPFTADKCITLAGKPKLFFFQACRGDGLDGGIRMYRSNVTDTDSSDTSYKLPTHADFLLAYSTVQGFYSWRNPEEGTWYIQTLCDTLNEYAATHDLVKMLTMVARRVATNFASSHIDPTFHEQKQVPVVTSVLLRDLYFTPKNQ